IWAGVTYGTGVMPNCGDTDTVAGRPGVVVKGCRPPSVVWTGRGVGSGRMALGFALGKCAAVPCCGRGTSAASADGTPTAPRAPRRQRAGRRPLARCRVPRGIAQRRRELAPRQVQLIEARLILVVHLADG